VQSHQGNHINPFQCKLCNRTKKTLISFKVNYVIVLGRMSQSYHWKIVGLLPWKYVMSILSLEKCAITLGRPCQSLTSKLCNQIRKTLVPFKINCAIAQGRLSLSQPGKAALERFHINSILGEICNCTGKIMLIPYKVNCAITLRKI